MQRLTESPERVLGAMQSPRQAAPREELQRLTSVIEGYADHVMARDRSAPDPHVRPDPRGDAAPPRRAGRGRAVHRGAARAQARTRALRARPGVRRRRGRARRPRRAQPPVGRARRCCPRPTSSTRPASGWPASTSPAQTDPDARFSCPSDVRSTERHGAMNRGAAEEIGMKVGVLGAGVMGAGSRRSRRPRATRPSVTTSTPARSASGEEHVTTGRYGFERGVERGKLTRDDADAARARLSFTCVVRRGGQRRRGHRSRAREARAQAAGVPRPRRRRARRARSWRRTRRGSRSAQIAEVTKRPELVIGWHWASPPAVMRLAEIVRGPATSDATVQTIVDLADRVRQEPGGHHRLARRHVGLRRQPRVHAR